MTRGDYRLGLDIGGTKTLGVLLDQAGDVLALRCGPTARGSRGVVRTAVETIDGLREDAGLRTEDDWSLGVGVPGLVDSSTGRVSHSVNLGLDGEGLDFGGHLGRRFGQRVAITLENDVNVAALGATTLLPPGARPDVAYLSVGTGLAAGLVLDGRLRRGMYGAAGEIGHLTFDPDGRPCPCGQRGCLETVASGTALTDAWRTDGAVPALELFGAADGGDTEAVRIRSRFADALAAAVRILCLTVDVEFVVVGGGVAQLGAPLREVVVASLQQQAAMSSFLASLRLPERLRLVPADYPVAAVGAAILGGGPR